MFKAGRARPQHRPREKRTHAEMGGPAVARSWTASFLHAHGTPPEASKRGWRPGYNYLIYEYIPEIVLMSPLLRWTDERRKVGGGI